MSTLTRICLMAFLVGAPTLSIAAPFAAWDEREQRVLALVNEQRALHGLEVLRADARLHEAAALHSQDMLADDFFAHDHPDGTTAAERVTAAGYRWQATGENIAAGSGRRFTGGRIAESSPLDAARDVMYGTDNLDDLASFARARGLASGSSYAWADVGRGWSAADWDAWALQRSRDGGWMGSRAHRGSILSERYTDLGAGYAYSGEDGGSVRLSTYWTQQFAAGDSAPVPPPVPEPEPAPVPVPPPERTPAPERSFDPAILVPIMELID